MPQHFLITGIAGFIGSHLADRLLSDGHLVTGVDNLVRGSLRNLVDANPNPRFHFFEADVSNPDALRGVVAKAVSLAPIDCVWHMAANSDIGAGVANPSIDLRDTFLTTFN